MTYPLFKHLPAKALLALGLTAALGLPLGAYSTPPATAAPSQATVKPGDVPKFKFNAEDAERMSSVEKREFIKPVSRPEVAEAAVGRWTPSDDVEVVFTVVTPPGCYQAGWKLWEVAKAGWVWHTEGPLDVRGVKNPDDYKKFVQEVLDNTMNKWTCLGK